MSSSFLFKFKEPIEKALVDSVNSFGPKTVLRDAVEYALKNGGKRFRPAIVYLVAEALGHGKDVTEAGLAVEFFHTASLIADDLPCMDDDDERREHPSVHKVYGEATALLATYALIAAGYDYIQMGAQKVGRAQICPLVIENASYNTGILGATGGQHEDLFPSDLTEEKVLSAIDKKTGTLFEISFVFGWLYGGGEISELSLVKAAARSFGRAFQISDDFLDLDQDDGVNYPAVVGAEKAFALLNTELDFYKQALKKLQLETPELIGLAQLVEKRIAQTPAVSFF
ncbi:MAG: Farnesyl diphosphate synthase [Chlamydiales bacterium]|nr:Farnesyl diphosphate synthase [Chlamydiales bacterium]